MEKEKEKRYGLKNSMYRGILSYYVFSFKDD